MVQEEQESFISHLVVLRNCLLKSSVAVLVTFLALMPWASNIYDILAQPMMSALPTGAHMIATGVVTPFLVPVKVTLMAAFLFALPIVLYQAWIFIAPGLYAHEKKLILPLVVASTLLFLVGIGFCYLVVFKTVFHFVAGFAPKSITPAPDIEQYLSFVMTMFLAFGVTFEVPVVVIGLVSFGVVKLENLREIRPYIIVGAFIVAAVVTPPDVLSQLMLAVPICLLYEAGLFFGRFVPCIKKPR